MKDQVRKINNFTLKRWLLSLFCLSLFSSLASALPASRPVADSPMAVSPFYKSTDSGATWVPLSDGLTCYHIASMAIDPSQPGTVYAGTDRGVFKTTDGGNHWVQSEGLITLVNVAGLALDPSNPTTIYAGGSTYAGPEILLKSTDAGASWKVISDGLHLLGLDSILIDPSNPATIYAEDEIHIYQSTDGGNTWRSSLSLPGTGDVLYPISITLSSMNPARVYVVGSSRVFQTVDGGSNWMDLTDRWQPLEHSSYPSAIAVDPTDAMVVYTLDGLGNLRKSSDGGQTWAPLSQPSPFFARKLSIVPSSHLTIFAHTNPALVKSPDGGQTWAVTGLSTYATTLAFDPADSSVLYAGAYGDVVPTDTPWINGIFVSGKKLTIAGGFFDDGAVILLNGEAQPTKPQEPNLLIAKKSGKKIKKNPDTIIQIRNANGKVSQAITIWPPLN